MSFTRSEPKMKNLHSKQSEQFIPPCLAISLSFALSVVQNICTFVDALTCKKATSMYEDHHRSARIEVQCVNVYHLANENQRWFCRMIFLRSSLAVKNSSDIWFSLLTRQSS